jgi:hypothetical protein
MPPSRNSHWAGSFASNDAAMESRHKIKRIFLIKLSFEEPFIGKVALFLQQPAKTSFLFPQQQEVMALRRTGSSLRAGGFQWQEAFVARPEPDVALVAPSPK